MAKEKDNDQAEPPAMTAFDIWAGSIDWDYSESDLLTDIDTLPITIEENINEI